MKNQKQFWYILKGNYCILKVLRFITLNHDEITNNIRVTSMKYVVGCVFRVYLLSKKKLGWKM